MLDATTSDLTYFALRTLFLVLTPLIVGVAVVGSLFSAIQSATSIEDSSTIYAVKLLAVVGLCYILSPLFLDSLQQLMRMAFE